MIHLPALHGVVYFKHHVMPANVEVFNVRYHGLDPVAVLSRCVKYAMAAMDPSKPVLVTGSVSFFHAPGRKNVPARAQRPNYSRAVRDHARADTQWVLNTGEWQVGWRCPGPL